MTRGPIVIKLQLGSLNNLRQGVRSVAPAPVPQRQSIDLAAILQTVATRVRDAWQWIERKRAQQFTSRRLRVAETMSLGEKRFVSIVQVDGVEMLLASSPGNVTLLKVLETKQALGPQRVARLEHTS